MKISVAGVEHGVLSGSIPYYFEMHDSTIAELEDAFATPFALWPRTPMEIAQERSVLGTPYPELPVGMIDDNHWSNWNKSQYAPIRRIEAAGLGVLDHYYSNPILLPVTPVVEKLHDALRLITRRRWTSSGIAAMAHAATILTICAVTTPFEEGWLAMVHSASVERLSHRLLEEASFKPIRVAQDVIEW
jgi:hypothetical protein